MFGDQILKKSSMKQEYWNEMLAWLSFLGVSAIFCFWLFLLVPFGSFLFHVFGLFSRRHALDRWKRAQRRHCKFGNDSDSRLWLSECRDGADYGFDGVDYLNLLKILGEVDDSDGLGWLLGICMLEECTHAYTN